MAVIGISGKIGSGKDTLAQLLQVHIWNERFKSQGYLKHQALEGIVAGNLSSLNEYSLNGRMFKQMLFAKKLKQFVADILGVSVEKLNDQEFKKSNLPVEWNVFQHYTSMGDGKRSMTVRELLIGIGDGMRERVHPDIWVNALFSQYDEESRWLIPDMRYPNEHERITKLAGVTIRVERPGIATLDHISETGLDNHKFNYTIINDSDLSSLYDKSLELYNELKHSKRIA